MTTQPRISVKGWCPGALRPMESGDGLVVRVRPRAGAFSLAQWSMLADAASLFGNGHLDLTRRGNLQLRGVTVETLPPLLERLSAAGLLDGSAAAEAVRNIMISPFAGLDDTEAADLRPVALALSELLGAAPDLHALAGKFGFVLDCGGRLSMAADRADVRLLAVATSEGPRVMIGLDTARDTRWLGLVAVSEAADAAAATARVFLRLAAATGAGRVRHLSVSDLSLLVAEAKAGLAGLPPEGAPAFAPPRHPVGTIPLGSGAHVAGVAVPFGRIEAHELRVLVAAAMVAGASEMRLSPWRILYVPTSTVAAAETVGACARALGLIVDASQPILRFEACPGQPACRSAGADTRGMARILAQRLADSADRSRIHISGCRKGCAFVEPAGLVLVAAEGGFDIIRNGRAHDVPVGHVSTQALAADPARVLLDLKDTSHG